METLIQALHDTLLRMTSLYDQFRTVLMREQECIVANNVEEMRGLVTDKETLAEFIQKAEEERLMLLDRIALTSGRERRELRVDAIAALSAKAGTALRGARDKLQAVVAQVKALNEVNNQLLKDSMQYIQSAFDMVTGKQNTPQGYGARGTLRTSINVKRNLVNTRA